MATFSIKLDKRTKLKNDKYNLVVHAGIGSDVIYINVAKITISQYEKVFVKKSLDNSSREFRETCNGYISKCERIYDELKPFNKVRFRELFRETDRKIPHSLRLKDLFNNYCTQNEDIKLKTRNHFRGTANVLETYRPGISVGDITVDFLKRFEKKKIGEGWSLATIDSHCRNLRRIINYFTSEVKLIPKQYEYPFGKGAYSISSFFPNKIVLKEAEIQSILDMTDFTNEKQEYVKEMEYARDIFLLLYYFNGANFADVLRVRWDQIQGDYIIFTRKKTETTRKNNKKDIVVPITPKLVNTG